MKGLTILQPLRECFIVLQIFMFRKIKDILNISFKFLHISTTYVPRRWVTHPS